MAQISRLVGGADDDGRSAITLKRAVEQTKRVGDHPGVAMILQSDRLFHDVVVIQQRMLTMRDRDGAEEDSNH